MELQPRDIIEDIIQLKSKMEEGESLVIMCVDVFELISKLLMDRISMAP